MPRGGKRQGKPGKPYPNRLDLAAQPMPVKAPPSESYGQRTKLEQAQEAVPMARPMSSLPGQLGGLVRETDRPGEPVTAGAPFGPGPGPNPLAPFASPEQDELMALFAEFPSDELAEIIEELNGGA